MKYTLSILNSNDNIELVQQKNKAFKRLKELHKQNRNISLLIIK